MERADGCPLTTQRQAESFQSRHGLYQNIDLLQTAFAVLAEP